MYKLLLTGLLSSFLIAVSSSSFAAVVTVEPDDFPAGTDISNSYPNVTLSTADGNPIFSATATSTTASTGVRVFGNPDEYWAGMPAAGSPDPYAVAGLSDPIEVLRVDFSAPTSFVSIDIIPDDNSDPSVLAAYDIAGNLLATFDEPGIGVSGIPVSASITRATADIAFIIVGGRDGDNVDLDNLQYDLAAASAAPIPTLSEWALLLLMLSLGILGVTFTRKQHIN